MISHVFYHQETVEEECALNSWESIRGFVEKDDEVIILDLGNTLIKELPMEITPKYLRIEKIRTDLPEERSYTFGLNYIMPQCRFEWICLWRSDYIYHKNYFSALKAGMKKGNAVLPYEAFIGADYCGFEWCKNNLDKLCNSEIEYLLDNSHVCPVYEYMDFPHFAIKKELWLSVAGMDQRLWGYGYQFPELFLRLKKLSKYQPSIEFDMIAFHQTHFGSFGLGCLNKEMKNELKDSKRKLLDVFGSNEKIEIFKKEIHQQPLRPHYAEKHYHLKNEIDIHHSVLSKCKKQLRSYKNRIG